MKFFTTTHLSSFINFFQNFRGNTTISMPHYWSTHKTSFEIEEKDKYFNINQLQPNTENTHSWDKHFHPLFISKSHHFIANCNDHHISRWTLMVILLTKITTLLQILRGSMDGDGITGHIRVSVAMRKNAEHISGAFWKMSMLLNTIRCAQQYGCKRIQFKGKKFQILLHQLVVIITTNSWFGHTTSHCINCYHQTKVQFTMTFYLTSDTFIHPQVSILVSIQTHELLLIFFNFLHLIFLINTNLDSNSTPQKRILQEEYTSSLSPNNKIPRTSAADTTNTTSLTSNLPYQGAYRFISESIFSIGRTFFAKIQKSNVSFDSSVEKNLLLSRKAKVLSEIIDFQCNGNTSQKATLLQHLSSIVTNNHHPTLTDSSTLPQHVTDSLTTPII